ncbi:hypothetical protein F511_17446 [Dorcoceras hygrometricum]|uniref:Zinc beta-ribbon domain-containing protein n=1 Tax=Dorcoceras hygrometricum TaxID=472368 RepID=A0A2Z7CBX7_9LAMI|nr:hypothetical protein F511_17446 [Dorcoceras hygrometricum]
MQRTALHSDFFTLLNARGALTPVAAADLRENLLPTRGQNQANAGFNLCLPDQPIRAQTRDSRPIATKPPSRNRASSSRMTDSLSLNCEETSTTFWMLCPTCRMLYEYINIFINQEILCHECQIPFMATRRPAPCKARVKEFLSNARASFNGEH